MLCISRVARINDTERFADGRHKFYLEYRCNRPCIENSRYCKHCSNKDPLAPHQFFMSYEHGDINQPITEKSHIFGGKWYEEAVKKYGAPAPEIIEFALQFQHEARKGFEFLQESTEETHKEETLTTDKEMPRAKATDSEKPKRTRKPKVSEQSIIEVDTVATEKPEETTKPKRTRKPKTTLAETDTKEADTSSPVKKPISRKKPAVAPIVNPNPVIVPPQMFHQEVSLPTHLETEIEEIDTDGYEIEYVKLTLFEVGNATYFRDSSKNKLYKKIKEKGIGSYIGRWNPDTESIVTDIPDSDDEN